MTTWQLSWNKEKYFRPWSCEAGVCDGDAQAGECKNTPMRSPKASFEREGSLFLPRQAAPTPCRENPCRRFLATFERSKVA